MSDPTIVSAHCNQADTPENVIIGKIVAITQQQFGVL
jgi:hypothetical protein